MRRKELLVTIVLLIGSCTVGLSNASTIPNAPHNGDSTVTCADCHTNPLPAPALRSTICDTCHDSIAAPLALTHSNDIIHGGPGPYPELSFACLDFHDPCFHDQLVNIPDLFLVTGTIDLGSIVDNLDGTSTLSYSSCRGNSKNINLILCKDPTRV